MASFELVAALAVLHRVLDEHSGVDVNVFIDSRVVLGTLLRGSSRQRDWNALLGSFWFRAARADAVVAAWCEPSDPLVAALGALRAARRWMPSALNPADAPTRPA